MASAYLQWKYRDVQPEKSLELTKKERIQNWWHYHKWHVFLAAVLVLIAADWAWNALHQVRPDYQIAYVGTAPLSDEAAAAWESRLAALGSDCDGDGRVTVRLNQYPSGPEDTMYAAASDVKLLADLDARESYFFLLENPERFQADYEILRSDWFPAEDGLYLARREFWEDRTAEHMQECDDLWTQLLKEAA